MSRSARDFVGAGELDRRVRIERKAEPFDPLEAREPVYGTELVTWEEVATVWANLQDALPSRSEAVLQNLDVAKNQTRIRMRWRDDVDSSMRLIDTGNGSIYQIIGGPATLGRRRFIEMQCERYGSLNLDSDSAWLWEDGSEIAFGDGSVMSTG